MICPFHGEVAPEDTMVASGVRVCGLARDGEHWVLYTLSGTSNVDGQELTAQRAAEWNGLCGEQVDGG